MNKKIRKPLSILLAVSMVSSLFVGTAVGKVRAGSSNNDTLFDKKITVLISQEGDQIQQDFTVASASSASLASSSTATIKVASSSQAEVGTVEVDEENKKVLITPNTEATPSEATVTVKNGGSEISGQATLRYNWFKSSTGTLEASADSADLVRADGVNDESVTVSVQDENGSRAADNVITAAFNNEKTKVTVTRGNTAITQDTTRRVIVTSNGTTIGICNVTVKPKQNGGEEDKLLKVFTKNQETVPKNAENWALPLTNEAEAVKSKLDFKISGNSVKFATSGALEVVGEGDATITTEFKPNSDKNGYTGLTSAIYKVTVTSKNKVDFFESQTKEVTLENGEVRELPLTASASEAHKNNKASVISNKEAVAFVDESKTTPGHVYVRAGKPAAKDQAVITFSVGNEYDEFTVIVNPVGQTDLFKLTEEEETNGVVMTVTENRKMALTAKAEELLQDEEAEVELVSDNNEVLTAEFGPDGSLVFTGKSAGEAEVTLKIDSAVDTCFVSVVDYSDKLDDILSGVTDNMTETEIKNMVDALEKIVKGDPGKENGMADKQPEYLNNLAKEDPDAVEAYIEQIESLEKQIKEKFQVETETETKSTVVNPDEVEVIGLALNASLTKIGQKMKLAIADTTRPPKTDGQVFGKTSVAVKIELLADDNLAEVKSPFKLTLNAPLDADELMVYHIHNGKVTSYRVPVVNGKINLYITRLSTFVFDYVDQSGGNNGNQSSHPSHSSSGGGGGFYANKAARNLYAMYGNWEQVGTSWKFKKTNGYYAKNEWGYINNSYYYFGDDQLMKTGWQYISNTWYYLNPAAGSEEGKMLTGWQQINGSLYYLNTSGAMAADQWIDGYYVNASGARVQ